ncbi:hypothetical protein PS1_044904 [Malus domestica]
MADNKTDTSIDEALAQCLMVLSEGFVYPVQFIKVAVTNFFGSVMETIHTDSAYKALSRTSSSRAEFKMPFDQSVNDDERRVLADSDR